VLGSTIGGVDDDLTTTGQTADRLGPDGTGRWLVTTGGRQHLWDLDAGTYRRLPGPGRGSFDYDGKLLTLTRIERWPAVGKTFFIWFDDPSAPTSSSTGGNPAGSAQSSGLRPDSRTGADPRQAPDARGPQLTRRPRMACSRHRTRRRGAPAA